VRSVRFRYAGELYSIMAWGRGAVISAGGGSMANWEYLIAGLLVVVFLASAAYSVLL
jgi:hypothetical protein